MHRTNIWLPVRHMAACLLLAVVAGAQSQPEANQDVTAQEATRSWQARRNAGLKDADGWLALAGLWPLPVGEHQLGSTAQAGLQLPAGAPARVGRLTVTTDAVHFSPLAGVEVQVAASDSIPVPVPDVLHLRTDGADAGPTTLQVSTITFWVIERVGKRWLRVSDAAHPALQHPPRIDCFPISAGWRVEAQLLTDPTAADLPVPTVLGVPLLEKAAGILQFELHGQRQTLHALDGTNGSLFVIFSDETNNQADGGTYGAGRFLWVPAPDEAGRTIIAFNRAYNPPCAFTAFATCPLPPPGNHLDVAVQAGEKRWAGQVH